MIFVRDVSTMAEFYEIVTGWPVIESGSGFVRLGEQGQQVVIHRAAGVVDEEPGQMRTSTPLKHVFVVQDPSILDRISAHGGTVLAKREFTHAGRRHVDVVDLEGNILQLIFPLSGSTR